ncbi:distal membrane-arm assembly complex protein 2 [Aphis craccivora]|uniref:Distal membrane-arm assembly complex protein 2 n=1 Tax=Aphis craccivora TaxID=307492 RepID=A0A6G0ZKV6_APHCR|nr:distal membrane-arm assembly complex protein 2 [Aphis craccivora]
MNSVRKIMPLCSKQVFTGKRFNSNSNDLTKEENKILYEKLLDKSYSSEKQTEASSFAKWVTPHYKFGPSRIMNYDWSIKNIYSWYKSKRVEFHKYNQRYVPERVKSLGSDIAVAHFIVYRGGAIRFRGQDNFIRWTNKKEEYFVNLPQMYDPNYFVEAIDASSLMFYYQGIENFKNLFKLKWLNLSNNPVLDNWCLDYIGHAIPTLEYLDISNCHQITAAGIAGLQKLTHLKILVINSNNIEIQMACFALEDIIPGLFVLIQDNNDVKLETKKENLNANEV